VLLRHVQSLENAVTIAETIRTSAMQPVATAAGDIRISLSIGVTLAMPGEGADALMARADAAMYEAKAFGRNRVIPIESGQPPSP
jgi:diguanylate cyclase (GGDEF)-like protein